MKLFRLLLFVLLAFACNEQSPPKEIQQESDLVQNDSPKDFTSYWNSLKNQLKDTTLSKINELTSLPLEIYGYEDRDPRIDISSKDSVKLILKLFLSQQNVSYENYITHRDLIQGLSNPHNYKIKDAFDSNSVRIEMMSFNRVNNEWKLTRIYMDTRKHFPQKEN